MLKRISGEKKRLNNVSIYVVAHSHPAKFNTVVLEVQGARSR